MAAVESKRGGQKYDIEDVVEEYDELLGPGRVEGPLLSTRPPLVGQENENNSKYTFHCRYRNLPSKRP